MGNQKQKVYMVCDWHDGKANGGAKNIGVEYMGNCRGRILNEDGTLIGQHHSSTFGWLRNDLMRKLDNQEDYEIIDLIGQEVPERFRLKEESPTPIETNATLGNSITLISGNKNANELRFQKLDKDASWGNLSNESILNYLGITDRKIYKFQFYDEKYIASEFKIWLCPLEWNPTPEEPYYNS